MLPVTDYIAYLCTQSPDRMLAEPVRARLFAAIADAVSGDVAMALDTLLYLARRR